MSIIQDLHRPNALSGPDAPHTNGAQEGTAQERLLALDKIKASLQARLEVCFLVLETNHVTMQTPLVDAEGFPRADIEVAGVRTARAEIHRLRNDLTATTNEMAVLLQEVLARQDEPAEAGEGEVEQEPDAARAPFAKVDGVFPGGPADQAVSGRAPLAIAIHTDMSFP